MARTAAGVVFLGALLLGACGGDDDGGGADAGVEADAGVDGDPFDEGHVLEVEIDMAPGDWDALRGETRSILETLGGDCLAQPFESPFTYREANITIDGRRFESVGVRKKGFLGSLSEVKPSLKVKMDEYVDGQELAGLDKLTFNNSQQDPSYVRQCLAYDVFRAAGIPASRCNFAHVSVNGDDLGLFVHVESLDRQFLERNYDDPSGKMYEGTLSDFRPDFRGTFDLKTEDIPDDGAEIDAVVEALALPDDELMDALEPLVDLDAFYTFWAVEVLTRHWDGYASNTNNFYLSVDPTSGKLSFIPWGVDGAFGPNPRLGDPGAPPVSVFATGLLARRLYLHPDAQAAYVARLEELLDSVWKENLMIVQVARMEELIAPIVDGGSAHADAVDEVREAITTQRAAIEEELAGGPPPWTQELRDPFCLATVGQVEVAFETTWGTQGAPDPFAAGTGTWTATVDGSELVDVSVGATAGDDPDAPRALVQVFANLDDDHIAVLVAQIEPSRYAAGDQAIDWNGVFGALYHYDPETDSAELLGYLGEGTLTLDEAGASAGAAVSGSITADVVRLPF
ncbi:MAG TPA: CotH kinase family protein [Kofleriaceae bacterium]|nr:CotH kinase family protein [Kofleriaceae bacterium]